MNLQEIFLQVLKISLSASVAAGLVMLLALHICSQLRYFYIISQGHIYYF